MLLAFSYNVLAGLELIRGGPVPEEEERAYLHLWRWVGRLLGLRDELNPCRAGMPLAKATLESIVLHLLHPDALSVRVAHHLLRAPRSSDAAFERSASMTRLLVGDELGDALELPWSLPGRRRARGATKCQLATARGRRHRPEGIRYRHDPAARHTRQSGGLGNQPGEYLRAFAQITLAQSLFMIRTTPSAAPA